MQSHLVRRTLAASHHELDAKLELLQQLGYEDRFSFGDDDLPPHHLSEKPLYLDRDTDRWIQTEFDWVEEAAEPAAGIIPDLFDVEEDEEACLPCVYDPTLFSSRQSLLHPAPPRSRSHSLTRGVDKPLPSVPPLRLRNRPSLPIVPPPPSPARGSFYSSIASTPASPRSLYWSPPPSPRTASSPRSRTFPRCNDSPSSSSPRPSAYRHATYPSISSTLSLLEERETEVDKRSAVYLADTDQDSLRQAIPKSIGRGRSSSAVVNGSLPIITSSPRRKQRPALPALATSISSPQLRELAELATSPSPACSLLPSSSLISDVTLTVETEVVSPGEAITENPAGEAAEPGLASRWSLDSVASRPPITRMALDDASSSPAKTRKRDRLLSLISGRVRSGSVTKPLPPPNTPRGSSDVFDIRPHNDFRDVFTTLLPPFAMPPKMAPSLSSSNSSNASSASTLATPIEPAQPSPLPDLPDYLNDSSFCVPEEQQYELPVFAENPYIIPESPLLSPEPLPPLPSHEQLSLRIPDRPMSPGSPPPQPTLPLPSPSTPSPSFFVPSPRPQSFFATLTGRQRRRKKKLVISGAPLELSQSRSSSSGTLASEDFQHRQAEQQRRVQNVVKWCESFGALRKIETKDDGSLHVYWKDWEVADMVCRIQAQVVIKDVGRVNVAWYYIS